MNFYESIESFFLLFLLYFGLQGDTIQALCSLMLLDSFFGTIRAIILGQNFSGKKLLRGVIRKISVLFVPSVVSITIKYGAGINSAYFVIITLQVLILNEGISILNNILSIKTGNNIEKKSFVGKIIQSIIDRFEDLMKKTINVLESEKKQGNDSNKNS